MQTPGQENRRPAGGPTRRPPAWPTSARIRALVCAAAEGERSAREELRLQGVLDGAPANPAGEYARHLVAVHYGGRRTGGRGHGHEVVLPDGEHLQVRGRHRKAHRDPTFFAFDYDPGAGTAVVVAVLFEVDFTLSGAWRIPWGHIERLAITTGTADTVCLCTATGATTELSSDFRSGLLAEYAPKCDLAGPGSSPGEPMFLGLHMSTAKNRAVLLQRRIGQLADPPPVP